MIPVSHTDSGPGGAGQNCATKLYSGDIKCAKRANIFRQAVSTDFLEKLNNDKVEQSRSYCHGCL